MRHRTLSLSDSHLTVVSNKGKLLPAVASLVTRIFANVQAAGLQMGS